MTNKATSLFEIVCHLFFAAYTFLCGYFYLERVIYIDTAYQYLTIIESETFQFYTDRYSNFLVELIPLLAIKIGLPIKYVLISISLSFPIVYYAMFLIVLKGFKNKLAAFIIPLVLVINTGSSFFFAINETTQGMVYSVIYLCIIQKNKNWNNSNIKNSLYLISEVCLILFCLFIHPITIFILSFILLITFLLKEINIKTLLFRGTLLAFPFFLKLIMQEPTNYEGKYFSSYKNIPEVISSLGDLQNIQFLSNSFMGKNDLYFLSIILISISTIWLVIKKKYIISLFSIVWIIIFVFISIIASHKGNSDLFMEIRFLPTAFFISFIAVYIISCLRQEIMRRIAYSFLFTVICFRVISIVNFSKKEVKRIEYIASVCSKNVNNNFNKFVVLKENLNGDILRGDWAFGAETLLYSASKMESQLFITPLKTEDEFDKFNLKSSKVFICPYSNIVWNTELKSKYFNKFDGTYSKL